MRLTEQGGAIMLIGFGLFLLFNGPVWVITHVIAPSDPAFAQKIAVIGAKDLKSVAMIVGGVALTIGALLGWRESARPKPN